MPTVAIKLGAEGAIAVSGGETVTARAPAVDVVDTTGAGDSFNAGLIAGRLAGRPPAAALALAVACGTLSTRAAGGHGGPAPTRRGGGGARSAMICVAANPSADATFSVDRLEPGAIHRPTAYVRVAGGKAMNVARAAVRLGGEAAVVALAPEHGAAWLREELEREGVTVETLPVPGVLRTCLSVFAADDGTLTEFYEGGAEIDAPSWTAFAELAAGRARADAGWPPADPCPRAPRSTPTRRWWARAARPGPRWPSTPPGAELDVAAAAGPDLIKVNEAEALAALGREAAEPGDQARAAELAAGLRERAAGRARVIVTLGERGAVLAGPEGIVGARLDRPPSPYAVGSGDAFLAGAAERARARAGLGGVHAARDRRRRRPTPRSPGRRGSSPDLARRDTRPRSRSSSRVRD